MRLLFRHCAFKMLFGVRTAVLFLFLGTLASSAYFVGTIFVPGAGLGNRTNDQVLLGLSLPGEGAFWALMMRCSMYKCLKTLIGHREGIWREDGRWGVTVTCMSCLRLWLFSLSSLANPFFLRVSPAAHGGYRRGV